LKLEANPNLTDDLGNTPLHYLFSVSANDLSSAKKIFDALL